MFKNNSSQVAALISPVHGCRDALRRKGKKPKDHHKDNVKYIKTVASLKKVKKTTVKRAASTIVGKNFVRENMKNVKNFQVSAPIESSDEEIFNVGEVPEYIGSIKNMLRTKKEERCGIFRDYEKSKEFWPQGTRLLMEDEKNEIILKLQREKEDVIFRINGLPFTSDTNATKARRSACETRLKELDFQLARLSLEKVYYPI